VGVQEWDEGVAAGLAALAALQRSLGELDAAQPAKEATHVLERLLQLVGTSARRPDKLQPISKASLLAQLIYIDVCCLRCANCRRHHRSAWKPTSSNR
jgi:hypothetical protein